MKIGELSAETGTAIETIRFYEREGLLPAPSRTSGNFRIYDDSHVERLAFIRHCRSLDMALTEIRLLLGFKDAPNEDCGEVNALLDEHIGHVATRIKELRALERQLKDLRRECSDGRAGLECGILSGLSLAAAKAPTPRQRSHVRSTHEPAPGSPPAKS